MRNLYSAIMPLGGYRGAEHVGITKTMKYESTVYTVTVGWWLLECSSRLAKYCL